MEEGRTTPDNETYRAEDREATTAHEADRMPTPDEESAAERARQDPELSGDQQQVASHYREMSEIGKDERGEGRRP